MRAERTEWFADRDPFKPHIEELLDMGLFLPLESKDVNNNQIFIIRTGIHDTYKHEQNDVLKVRSPIAYLIFMAECIRFTLFDKNLFYTQNLTNKTKTPKFLVGHENGARCYSISR